MAWEANERADPEYFEHFASSLLSITSSLTAAVEDPAFLMAGSRAISVELRKLLLAGSHSLVQRCVREPRLHRLLRPNRLHGDVFEERLQLSGGSLRIKNPASDWEGEWPMAPASMTATVEPLYGLRYDEGRGVWISEDPYDRGRKGIRLRQWLNQGALQIDHTRYTLGNILSDVANTQGAHVDKRKDSLRHRLGEHFAPIYLNIFAVLTGAYVAGQVATSLAEGSSLSTHLEKHYPRLGNRLRIAGVGMEIPKDGISFHDLFVPVVFRSREPSNASPGPSPVTVNFVAESVVQHLRIKVPAP